MQPWWAPIATEQLAFSHNGFNRIDAPHFGVEPDCA